MLFGGSRKERYTFELVLDVRSASVGGSIVAYGGTVPAVLYATRVPIASNATGAADALVQAMLVSLGTVLDRIVRDGLQTVATTHGTVRLAHATLTFGAPWYLAKVEDVQIKKEQPFTMTRKKFETLLATKVDAEKQKQAGQTMIEHDVTHVVINGYELDDPFDKKTKEMLISFYASFVSTQTLKKITNEIDARFHRLRVSYRTFPIVLFTTLRDMFWNVDRFTFFDVSGLVTEIGIVEGGTITHMLSIPYGTQHLLKDVQTACSMEATVAASAIAMLARGEVHPSCNVQVLEAVKNAQKQWLEQLRSVIDREGLVLPQRVFVSVDHATAPLCKQILSAPETRKNIFATDQELQLAVLTAEQFKKYATFSLDEPVDPFILLTGIFLQATK